MSTTGYKMQITIEQLPSGHFMTRLGGSWRK